MNENKEQKIDQEVSTTSNVKSLSDNQKLNTIIKNISIIMITGFLLWFIILSPYLSFRSNEKAFQEAARKYFDTYTAKLPTKDRIGEVSLQELYDKGFLTKDFYVPYSIIKKDACSITDSWVKVTKSGNDYKYHTYLKCGILSSNIDNKGPKITLKGAENMQVSLDEKFKDPGVKSVYDSKDGDIDIKNVTVTSNVDTSKIGEYTVKYTVADSLNNKTTVTRKVSVVQKINSTVKKATNDKGYYTGDNPNNYIYFSGMLFRIVDIDKDNVRIIQDMDVANVNHDGIDNWLKYYYKHLASSSKKLIVKNTYCNSTLEANNLNSTECSNKTKKKDVYIASIEDINKAQASDGNYLKPTTMSWTATKASKTESYVTRYAFFNDEENAEYLKIEDSANLGVRPIITIKGDATILSGDGTIENPYNIGDFERGIEDSKVNERNSGEYIKINGNLWQVVDKQSDGSTKIILNTSLSEKSEYLYTNYNSDNEIIYNPKNKKNVGYFINNRTSEYVNSKLFVSSKVKVPIYKDNAKYGKEQSTKTYTVKYAAPNMYEMFSATSNNQTIKSYWYINSSKNSNKKYAVAAIGASIYEDVSPYISFGIRPVAFLNKNCIIVNGSGTEIDPYTISK